ncbi:hypothetical protein R6Z07M_013607 [Ovis aries]
MLPLLPPLLWAALTDAPDVHVQGTLASGRPTNLTCAVPWACERGTPPTFSWTRVALTSPHPKSPHSSVLTLTPRPQDHGTNLTCRVTFPGAGVSTEATMKLNVSFPKILGNATSLRVWEGQSLCLVCVSDSNPPTNGCPDGSWFPSYLWPQLDLLHHVQKVTGEWG